MNRISILSICISLVSSLPVFGQQTLSGTVKTENEGLPVEFANVALYQGDSLLVTGTSTDKGGRFRLATTLTNGNLVLQVSCIGFRTEQLKLIVGKSHTDLGDILLTEESQELSEAVAIASDLRQTDRLLVYPSTQQLKFSANGFDLLMRLQLPRLWVDPLNKSIEIPGGGAVGFLINGKPAEQADINTLPTGDILRVEYIDRPGLRYKDYEAVLNYVTKAKDSGGTLTAEAEAYLKYYYNGTLLTKINHKRSEWGFAYSYNHARKTTRDYHDKEECYVFSDSTLLERAWESKERQGKARNHSGSLYYSHLEKGKHYFNATLRLKRLLQPLRKASGKMESTDGTASMEKWEYESQDYYVPSLEFYYDRHLPRQQFIAFNAVGTYMTNTSQYGFDNLAGSDTVARNMTHQKSQRLSWIAEGFYEKQWESLTLSAGIKDSWSRTENRYRTSQQAETDLTENLAEAFVEASKRSKRWQATLGIGAYCQYFKEGQKDYVNWSYKISLNVNYVLSKTSSLNLRALADRAYPGLTEQDPTPIQNDEWTWTQGNPEAKPWTTAGIRLAYALRGKNFSLEARGSYSHDFHPVMDETRREGDQFVTTYDNQKASRQVQISLPVQIRIWQNYLALQITPLLIHTASEGDSYSYHATTLSYTGTLMASYKNLQLSLISRNPFKQQWGEVRTHAQAMDMANLTYRHKHWLCNLILAEWLGRDYSYSKKERLSPVCYSYEQYRHADKIVMLRISYTLPFGKNKPSGKARLNNQDSGEGILRPIQ